MAIGHLGVCYLNGMKLFLISSNQYHSPEGDSNLVLSRIAVFEDYKATALTAQPPQLDEKNYYYDKIKKSINWF